MYEKIFKSLENVENMAKKISKNDLSTELAVLECMEEHIRERMEEVKKEQKEEKKLAQEYALRMFSGL